MRYFFTGKIEKKDNLFCIRIPFNVWEVCKQRDVIQGDLILDNKHIDCELLPEEKGNYKIHLKDEDVAHIDVTQPHKILLHIGSSLIKMDQNSPYSFDNPIRRIDHIDIITQPEDGLCGQTCIAMLAGVTLDEACEIMHCRDWQASMGKMVDTLDYLGLQHENVIYYTQGAEVTLPKCAILMEKMGRYSHYLLCYDGTYYDPTMGILDSFDQKNLVGYLEIKTA